MEPPAALQATLAVASAFERSNVSYLVGGSLASSFSGLPRATQDADLLAALAPGDVDEFVAALAGEFYAEMERIRPAVEERSSFNVIHLETMFKVDVFVLGEDPLDQEQMRRRRELRVGDSPGSRLFVASPEDTVLQKLRWYRRGNEVSDRQWGDAVGILKVQRGRLDSEYLLTWARRIGVADLLERVIEEAET